MSIHALNRAVVNALYPNAPKGARRRLVDLLSAKRVQLIDLTAVRASIEPLMYSVIRHNGTHYDSLVREVGRDKARAILQPIIQGQMSQFTKETP